MKLVSGFLFIINEEPKVEINGDFYPVSLNGVFSKDAILPMMPVLVYKEKQEYKLHPNTKKGLLKRRESCNKKRKPVKSKRRKKICDKQKKKRLQYNLFKFPINSFYIKMEKMKSFIEDAKGKGWVIYLFPEQEVNGSFEDVKCLLEREEYTIIFFSEKTYIPAIHFVPAGINDWEYKKEELPELHKSLL